jgi:hypothetical protein
MRNPTVATDSKKGDALVPQGAPMAKTAGKLGVAAQTPVLCLPSAYARTCARLGLAKVQSWKQEAARLGVAGAGEVGFERACACLDGPRKKPGGELRSWATRS